jgi:hypothetical protein
MVTCCGCGYGCDCGCGLLCYMCSTYACHVGRSATTAPCHRAFHGASEVYVSVSASANVIWILTPSDRDACEAASEILTAKLCGCVSWEEEIGCCSKAICGGGRGRVGGDVWVIVSDVCKQENANGICGFRHRGCLCFCCHLCDWRHLAIPICRRCAFVSCETAVWESVGWRNCDGVWEEVLWESAGWRNCGGALEEARRNGFGSGCRRASGAGVCARCLGMGGLGRSCQLRAMEEGLCICRRESSEEVSASRGSLLVCHRNVRLLFCLDLRGRLCLRGHLGRLCHLGHLVAHRARALVHLQALCRAHVRRRGGP